MWVVGAKPELRLAGLGREAWKPSRAPPAQPGHLRLGHFVGKALKTERGSLKPPVAKEKAPNFVPRRDTAAERGAASPGALPVAGRGSPIGAEVREAARAPEAPAAPPQGGRALGSPGRAGLQVAGAGAAGPALKGAIVPSYSWYAPGREPPGAASSGREREGRRVPAGGSRQARGGAAPPGRAAAPGVPALPHGPRLFGFLRPRSASELPGGGVPRGGGGGGGDGAGSVKRRQLNDSGRRRAPAPPSTGRPPLAAAGHGRERGRGVRLPGGVRRSPAVAGGEASLGAAGRQPLAVPLPARAGVPLSPALPRTAPPAAAAPGTRPQT